MDGQQKYMPMSPSQTFKAACHNTSGFKRHFWAFNILILLCATLSIILFTLLTKQHVDTTTISTTLAQLASRNKINLSAHEPGQVYSIIAATITLTIIIYFWVYYSMMGSITMAAHHQQKQTPRIGIGFKSIRRFFPFLALIIIDVAAGLATIVLMTKLMGHNNHSSRLIIADIILFVVNLFLFLAKPLVLIDQCPPWKALSTSVKIATKHFWRILGTWCFLILLMLAAMIIASILARILPLHFWLGKLIFIGFAAITIAYLAPLYYQTIITIYAQLFPKKQAAHDASDAHEATGLSPMN